MTEIYEKHPSYGYLTKEEYEAMKKAPYGAQQAYKKIAASREKRAKRMKAGK